MFRSGTQSPVCLPPGKRPAMVLRDLTSWSEGQAPPRTPHVASAEARLTTHTCKQAWSKTAQLILQGTEKYPECKEVDGRKHLAI